MIRNSLTLAEARRLALGVQGFGQAPHRGQSLRSRMQAIIRRLGLLQLDFVNVLVPAQQLIMYSRLGAYDRQVFHDLVYRDRCFTEQWAHEACIVPIESWPLLGHRHEQFRPWAGSPIHKLRNKKKYLSEILEIIKEKGPITVADLPTVCGPKRRPGDWHRSIPRWGLEWHFGSGRLAIADRLPNFQRVYDLRERLIPAEYLERKIEMHTAQRELLLRAARSSGVATLRDLADYFRMPVPQARPRLLELVEQGALQAVQVEGWPEPAYLASGARVPRAIDACALLSPFDPVVWYRPRAERLFDFHYRIEIYVPAAQRRWGYYVLPFLLGDRIVARVDLKADRAKGRLLVLTAHAEPNTDEAQTCERLIPELTSLATWLELETVKISRRGAFARRLHAALRANGR